MENNKNVICAETIGLAWIKSLTTVLQNGHWEKDGNEKLKEINNLYINISSISGDDAIIQKYADKNRISFMKIKYQSCEILKNYKVSYGKLIYNNNGVNQIDWVINKLIQKPETKSATIGLHIPGKDELSCLSLLDFKLRNGFLILNVVFRSQNIFGSQPGNILALHDIQKHVANKTKSRIGDFNLIVFSAHIYETDIEFSNKIINDYSKNINTCSLEYA